MPSEPVITDRFAMDGVVGHGGMGTVYRARDLTTGALVAVKLLSASAPNPAERERFHREAAILAELRHPHIVAYIDHGQTADGRPYLVMQWLEGEDLASRLQRGPLTLRDSILLVRQVAAALAVAHAAGIVHRDLKPQNLYLPGRRVEQVTILDFGIARRTSTAHVMTRTGALVGTPQYMAPEQARGARDLGPAADLFALGCVLYECLVGEPPFTGEHLAAVLVKILMEDPPPLDARRHGVPAALAALVGRLLAKHPDARPANAAALLQALDALGPLPDEEGARTLPVDVDAAKIAGAARTPPNDDSARLGAVFGGGAQRLFCVVVATGPTASPALAETAAPEELDADASLRARLSGVLRRLDAAAEFLIDGTLVVATAPGGSAIDEAVQGARAALLIKEEWLGARVALATGRGVLQGQRPVGEVVERALRLLDERRSAPLRADEQPGPVPTGVWLDDLSADLLDGRFQCERRGGQTLLLAESAGSDEARPLLGRPTPCVGREQELGILDALFGGCVDESRAQAVLVTAPPGVGKTRLRREFLRRLHSRGAAPTVLLGQADRLTAGSPLSLLRQALLRYSELGGSEPEEKRRVALQARLGRHLAAAGRQRTLAFLGELCDVRFPDEGDALLQTARRDPALLTEHVGAAFVELLRAECAAAPVVLVLEDLQWCDRPSVRLIDRALREAGDVPFLVLALARPEVQEQHPDLWQGHALHRLTLGGLVRRACERLIHQVLGQVRAALAPEVVARLADQAAGNALYLEELIRAAAEGRDDALPQTVLAMLQARQSRLSASARRVLHAACLFGQSFWLGGLRGVLAGSHDDEALEADLRALVAAEFIEAHRGSRLMGEVEYGFRHALMREAAYAMLTDEDRRLGHRLAGEYLERAGAEDPLVLVEHYQRAGEAERTVPLFVRAAEAAERAGAYPELCRAYQAALDVLATLVDTEERRRQRAHLLLRLLPVSATAEPPDASLARLEEATRLLSGTPAEAVRLPLGMIDALRGRILLMAERYDDAAVSARAAWELGRELGAGRLQALGGLTLGYLLGMQGHAITADEYLHESARIFAELQGDEWWNRAQTFRAVMRTMLGDLAGAQALLHEAAARARALGHPVHLAYIASMRGVVHQLAGDWPAAVADLREAIELCERNRILNLLFTSLVTCVQAELRLGPAAVPDAQAHLAQAEALVARMGGRLLGRDQLVYARAETARLSGRLAEACALAEEVRALGFPYSQGIAERIRGLALADLGDGAEAEASLARGIAVHEGAGLRVEAARTRLYQALLCRRFGEEDRAQALYEVAAGAFAACGCDYALGEARRLFGA